jgi:23S rRNA pseudouridine2605 synthase
MRIAKALALAGIDSRRKSETYILEGAVSVNGKVVKDLGRQVDVEADKITFRGKPLVFQKKVYYLLNKPAGYTTTVSDPHASKTVMELLPSEFNLFRLFPVGRLDRESTGLLLMTNDGDLAQKLTHPRYGVGKRYEVTVNRPLETGTLKRLMRGVQLEEGLAQAEQIEVLSDTKLRLLLREGKKREIRRMFEQNGYTVKTLCRIEFGPLKLEKLALGSGRSLTDSELDRLRKTSR